MKHLYYEHHCKKHDWTLLLKVGVVPFGYFARELSHKLRPIIIHASDMLGGLNSKKGSVVGKQGF